MAEITIPDLDSRDEDTVVAEVIDDLPAELSDRNSSAVAVKLVEGVGAFYGLLLYLLNQVPRKMYLVLLELLGVELEEATTATGTVTFGRTNTSTEVTIPAGSVVKTGTGADAIKYETDAACTLHIGDASENAAVTAVETGADGNVPAATIIYFDVPVSGIDTVTNAAACTGGQDEEPLDSAIARAPLAIRSADRAITREDFEYQATEVAGVSRALCVSEYPWQVSVYVLADDLNEVPSTPLLTAVESYLEERTLPGIEVEPVQEEVILVMITEVEVELEDGYTIAGAEADIEEVLTNFLTAVDIYDSDQTLVASGWEWGRDLYENDLSSRIAQVTGVRRVGAIKYQSSSNYGGAWSAEATLSTITPPATYGLIHWGGDYSPPNPFTVVEM